MKLNAAQIEKVEEVFACEAVPEDSSVLPRLTEAFGEHTYFLSQEGLNIVAVDETAENQSAKIITLASWADDRSSLIVHDPKVGPEIADLGSTKPAT